MKKFIKQHPIVSWSLIVLFAILNLFFDRGLFSDSNFIGADGVHQISTGFMLLIMIVVVPMAAPAFLSEYEKPAWKRICLLFAPFGIYIFAQTLVFLFFNFVSKPFAHKIHPLLIVALGVGELALVFLYVFMCSVLFFLSEKPRWYLFGFLAVNFSPWLIAYGLEQISRADPLLKNLHITPAAYNPLLFLISFSRNIFVTIAAVIAALAVCILLMRVYKKINVTPLYAAYKIIVLLLMSLSVGFLPLLFIEKISSGYIFVYAAVTFVTLVALMLVVFKKYKLTLITVGTSLVAIALAAAITILPPLLRDRKNMLPEADEIESVKITLDSLESCVVASNFDECLELHGTIIEILERKFTAGEDNHLDYTTNVWDKVTFWYTLKNGKTFVREYRHLDDMAFDSVFVSYLQSDMYHDSLKNTDTQREPVMRYSGKQCVIEEHDVEDIISTYCDELKNATDSDFYDNYTTVTLEHVYELPRDLHIPNSFTKTRDKIDRLMFYYRFPY